MTTIATSPAASGPAGSYFEGQVGAYYLLSMLTGSVPRGLPGTVIDRVELQRAAEGRPLDDVIVHAHNMYGNPAIIEIQVKRSITFAPSDPVFKAVVDQIAKVSLREDFWTSHYELAIATSRTSRKIDGAYQTVLTWARQLGNAATFTARINRPGSASDEMRTFVRTFKQHLHDAGTPDNDEIVWSLLRKLQILVFDFTAQGSESEQLVKERAVRALHPDSTLQAGMLWATLVNLALQIAASGGDRNRDVLIEDLRSQSFCLAGNRRFSSTRSAIAEASHNALADIGDKVGDVTLARYERVAAVHNALDKGRYIDIRGDAGVGKSGILKHFAEQIATEAQVVVLSPGRTTQRGWTAMRATLGFDGTARELLSDLAGDGGGILFIDNLDFFSDEERRTVVDLVREAAGVPGFAVITTARRNFGVEESNWLPMDALDSLGKTTPIMIDELSETEIEEMRQASPMLAQLLADTHPARAVARNLFRLARLASQSGENPVPRTEVDMAEQWWQTADGKHNSDYRERARLLKALARQVLARTESLDVCSHSSKVIDALVKSETLRDLGNDRVAFRHDVLREWALANLLHIEPNTLDQLSLDRPTPPDLARGVELAARMAIEHDADGLNWKSLLTRLSREGTHGSWRRAVLLALVHSEIGSDLLTRASDILLANRASILRELICIVMAVDVEPISKLLEHTGVAPDKIPASLNTPNGLSWYRLIRWLLSLGHKLPAAAIPDVVDLYNGWSIGMFGLDPLSPLLTKQLYLWLIEIETARNAEYPSDRHLPFNGGVERDRIESLETDLRTSFLMFCKLTPALAEEYLQAIVKRWQSDNIVRSILKFRGSLAQAAPLALADLTLNALIPEPQPDNRKYRNELTGPFDFYDTLFLPASPSQGPFFDLLTHAPQCGLSLINRLIEHAIEFYSRGLKSDANKFTISLSNGNRDFPWRQSYAWSRDIGSNSNILTSALMALEAWAHQRIDAGEAFDKVLADVLGPPGSPAAYLLVAVDLLISHWPKSREEAVPFLACPELLCIDRNRHVYDNFEYPGIYGLMAHEKEPVGTVSTGSLKKRTSRRHMLDELLPHYAIYGPAHLRDKLAELLSTTVARLGSPHEQSDLGDPAFMASHALNLIDPNNYQEVSVTLSDGKQKIALRYVSPETERRHLEALQTAAQDRNTNANMEAAISLALDNAFRSSNEFAAAAVKWAQSPTALQDSKDMDDKWIREHAVVIAAMIAMRDGDEKLRADHSEWIRTVFAQAINSKKDSVHRFRSGLRYNPIAIAFAGMIHSLRDHAAAYDIRTILEVAARDNPAAAHGFGATIDMLAAIDERLPRAVLRCALAASIRPSRKWEMHEEEDTTSSELYRQRVQATIEAELKWLADESAEPDWPIFPLEPARRRLGIRLHVGGGHRDKWEPQQEEPRWRTDSQAAALWLRSVRNLYDVIKRPWLRDIVRNYALWTFTANGSDLEMHEGVSKPPREWNYAYFDLLAHCLPGLTLSEIKQLALTHIVSLPDESFFDVMSEFLRCMDDIYFNESNIDEAIAVEIRSVLAKRLMGSSGWKRLIGSRSTSIEFHIGPAIATLFFNYYDFVQPAKCYLLQRGIDRLDPFLPVLNNLIDSSPSILPAIMTLNLVEVSPRSTQLLFVIKAAKAWLGTYPNGRFFWVDHDIGRRVCVWIEKIWREESTMLDTNEAVRFDVDQLLTALVSMGVADARRLEEALDRGIERVV